MTPSLTPEIPYKALIFDCDGTLANTLPLHFRVWAETLRSAGVELPEEWYYRHSGISSPELVERVNQDFGCELDPIATTVQKRQLFHKLISQVQEIPAVTAVVRQHYGNVPMAIASGGERNIVDATLAAINMTGIFDTIVCINDVQRGKPAPDLLLLAAERLEVDPQDCVLYEDSDSGLEAARRIGMAAIDVRVAW
jgi:beta-phosphoglucomutase-like phosphatase (HAD superfamily)